MNYYHFKLLFNYDSFFSRYYCNCGNGYGKHGKLDESECDNTCSGDTHEVCGGQSKNSVYETGVVTTSILL